MEKKMGRERRITSGVKVSFFVPYTWNKEMARMADKDAATLAEVYRRAVKEYLQKRTTIVE